MSNQEVIEKLWDQKDQINFIKDSEAKKNIENVLNLLDQGKLRVCEKKDDIWHVNQWLKKTILLSFRIQHMEMISSGPSVSDGNTTWCHKVPSKIQK
jgi:2,3,4,5-tetrahydropyridine-2-carboxylate N-succinyltransferase